MFLNKLLVEGVFFPYLCSPFFFSNYYVLRQLHVRNVWSLFHCGTNQNRKATRMMVGLQKCPIAVIKYQRLIHFPM